jgi:hypothetical protein
MKPKQALHPSLERVRRYLVELDVRQPPPYAAEYAALAGSPGPNRFFVARQGGTGSTWLAKTLNSHPNVYCTHEGIFGVVFPRKTYDVDDHLRFVERIARDRMHGAYAAIGDVGSTWLGQQMFFPPAWETGWLIRHPVHSLNFIMQHIRVGGASFPAIPESDWEQIEAVFDVRCPQLSPEEIYFLHHAGVWARGLVRATLLNGARHILRIEDMSDPDRLREMLAKLTGLTYGDELLDAAMNRRVNAREGAERPVEEVFSDFTPKQRRWMCDFLTPFAELAQYQIPAP